jgi:L-ascorbate metabolism protein UlaG (beta-lactamase superfamily)
MEIEFYGANAIKLKGGAESIGFDLVLPGVQKPVGLGKDLRAVFCSDKVKAEAFGEQEGVDCFRMPGEYEIGVFGVKSVAVPAQGDVYRTTKSNVYLVDSGDFGFVGIIAYADKGLSGEALELLANARLLVVPVGNGGLSLDPEDALKLVKDLNAEFVIPVHFDDGKTKYEVGQSPVETFVGLTGKEAESYDAKLNTKKLRSGDEGFKVVVIKP